LLPSCSAKTEQIIRPDPNQPMPAPCWRCCGPTARRWQRARSISRYEIGIRPDW